MHRPWPVHHLTKNRSPNGKKQRMQGTESCCPRAPKVLGLLRNQVCPAGQQEFGHCCVAPQNVPVPVCSLPATDSHCSEQYRYNPCLNCCVDPSPVPGCYPCPDGPDLVRVSDEPVYA